MKKKRNPWFRNAFTILVNKNIDYYSLYILWLPLCRLKANPDFSNILIISAAVTRATCRSYRNFKGGEADRFGPHYFFTCRRAIFHMKADGIPVRTKKGRALSHAALKES